MLHLLFGTNYPSPFVPSPQKQLMSSQCYSHHVPYLINNFLCISRHIFSLFPFLPRFPLFPPPSTFSTSHCPFPVTLSSVREYTSVSWFCGHYNLLLYIDLSIYLFMSGRHLQISCFSLKLPTVEKNMLAVNTIASTKRQRKHDTMIAGMKKRLLKVSRRV